MRQVVYRLRASEIILGYLDRVRLGDLASMILRRRHFTCLTSACPVSSFARSGTSGPGIFLVLTSDMAKSESCAAQPSVAPDDFSSIQICKAPDSLGLNDTDMRWNVTRLAARGEFLQRPRREEEDR